MFQCSDCIALAGWCNCVKNERNLFIHFNSADRERANSHLKFACCDISIVFFAFDGIVAIVLMLFETQRGSGGDMCKALYLQPIYSCI